MSNYMLGKWDLSKLATDPKSASFRKKIQHVEKISKDFEKNKSKLDSKISSKKFFSLIHELEDLYEKVSVLDGYASLDYAANTQSDEATTLLTKMSKLSSDISNRLLFFDLWWKRKIDSKNAKRLINDAGELASYLEYKRLVAKYSLTEPEERIINTLDVTGSSALVKLYDKITNSY